MFCYIARTHSNFWRSYEIITVSYFCWKETSHKPLKVAAAKRSFPSVFIIVKNCFDECFLVHGITGRRYFLYKFGVTQRFGAIIMLLRSLKEVFWKRSAFYVHYCTITLQFCWYQMFKINVPFLKFSRKKYFLITFLLHSFIMWIAT